MRFLLGVLAQSNGLPESLPWADFGGLGIVGVIVWWLVRRADKDDDAKDVELARLRTENAEMTKRHTEQLSAQQERHAEQLAAESESWRTEVAKLRDWSTEQIEKERQLTQQKSIEKHAIGNELAKSQGLMWTIASMAGACTCGALISVQPVIDRWQAEHPPLGGN